MGRKPATKIKDASVKSCQWWRASEENKKPHEMLDSLVKKIRDEQSSLYDNYRTWGEAFEGINARVGAQLSINELQNTLETLHAQIFKANIVPAPCPSEGDYEEQFRAMAFGRWLEGVLDEAQIFHTVIPQMGMDALKYGTGCVKVHSKYDGSKAKICFERVNPKYLYVDKIEGKHGRPRNLYQRIQMDRWVAYDKYAVEGDGKEDPEKALAIIEAKQLDSDDWDTDDSTTDGDQLTIWEAWHLGTKQMPGRHVIWIKGCTLVDEEYDEPEFPWVFLRFGVLDEGFWGTSAVARLMPAQFAYDKLTHRIDKAHDLLGVPRLIKRTGSILQKAHLDDDDEVPILETDQPASDIKEWNPQPITPEAYSERDSLPQRMRGSIGISGFEAQLQLPQQLREASGAAMERWVEAGNARHAMLHKAYESCMINLAWAAMREAAACEKDNKDVVVKAPGAVRSTVEMLSFKDVKLDMERLKLRVLPVSQLPRTFAGRVKELITLRDRGDITQKTYLRLLEMPDIEAEIDNYVSDEDIIRKNMDYMLRTGKYMTPLPYDNLDLIVKLAVRKIHEVRVREEEEGEDKVALLVQYIEDALALKNGVGPDPMAAVAPPGMAPPMGPEGLVPPPGGPLPPMPPEGAAPPMPVGPVPTIPTGTGMM